MRHAFIATACACAISAASASPFFSEVLPNTADDASLEYFSLRNSACVPVSLSGYSVVDASGKSYALPDETLYFTGSERKFFRPESKITLNNENETLSLFDPFGAVVDSFSYASSSKGVPIVRSGVSVPACPVPEEAVPSSETVPDQASDPSEPPVESPDPAPSDSQPSDAVPDVSEEGPADGVPAENSASVPGTAGPSSGTEATTGSGEDFPSGSWSSESTGATVSDASASGTSALPVPTPVISETSGGSVSSVSASRAAPEYLALVDSDADGRFDWAEIRYSENLSGTADPGEYLLYSNTGGLYANRVATLAGYFSRAEISGSVLRLAFSGTTLPKASMRVDASTSSEFRIKSASVSSLRTLSSGLPVVALALTTSFSGYAKDRVEFVPAFPETGDEAEPSEESAGTDASGTATQTAGTASGPSASGTVAPANAKASAKKPASAPKAVPEPDLSAIEIVPSSGVDLLPSGKYRYECFSTSCPVSFGVTGVPKGGKGYWEFSDGRKRYGTSTSTLGKKVPAHYRFEYVFRAPGGEKRFPVSVSVFAAEEKTVTSATAKKVTKTTAASKDASSGTKTTAAKKVPAVKSPSKTSSGKTVSAELSADGADNSSSFLRLVSAAVAATFLGLFAGAWFTGRFRSRRGEELE